MSQDQPLWSEARVSSGTLACRSSNHSGGHQQMHSNQHAPHEKLEHAFGYEYQNNSLSPEYSDSLTEQHQSADDSLQEIDKSTAPESYHHPHDMAQSLPMPFNPQFSHHGLALDSGSETNTRGVARRIHPIQSYAHTHHSFQSGYGPGVDPRIRLVGALGALQTDPRHRLRCLSDDRLVYFTSEVSNELEDVMVYEGSHGRSHMVPGPHGLDFSNLEQSVHAAVSPNGCFELDGSTDRHRYTDSASLESYYNAIRSNSYGEVPSPIHNRDNDEVVMESIEQASPNINLDSSGNRNPKMDPSYRPHFRDILQARAYRNRARSTPQYLRLDDHTLPYVKANIHGFVAQLYAAMKNVDGVRDETTSTGYKRLVSHYHKDIDIEARCWEVVELCIDLHEHGYRLDDEENLAHHSPKDQDLTCARRLEELCHILRIEKMMAEDVMAGTSSIMKLVYAPIASERRKIQNRRGNRRKKETLDFAKEVQRERRKSSATDRSGRNINSLHGAPESDGEAEV